MLRLLLLLSLLCSYSFAQTCANFNLTADSELELPSCNQSDGSITITDIIGGAAPFSFTLDTIQNQTGIFTNLPIGFYSIIIEDNNGCIDTLDIDFNHLSLDRTIFPSNAFTPNGDNINDLWFIGRINRFPNAVVRVFNRYGQQLINRQGYNNNSGWDGTQNGRKIPSGTYFYVISAFNPCAEEYIKGTVAIAR